MHYPSGGKSWAVVAAELLKLRSTHHLCFGARKTSHESIAGTLVIEVEKKVIRVQVGLRD